MTTIRPNIINNNGKKRLGKGFSREELKKAGSSLKEAVKFGVPIDAKRKTAHEENIEAAKTFLQKKKTESKEKKTASEEKRLALKEKKNEPAPKKRRAKPKS